jgi:hypothetical protein
VTIAAAIGSTLRHANPAMRRHVPWLFARRKIRGAIEAARAGNWSSAATPE